MIAVFVMSLVISGGLAAVGQATLLSEKSRKQVLADFHLRTEVEHLRSLSWTEVEALRGKVTAAQGGGKAFTDFQTSDADALAQVGLSADTRIAPINGSAARGKNLCQITLSWTDRIGMAWDETRVFIIAEGGISAR